MTIGNVIAAIIGYGFTGFLLLCILISVVRLWLGYEVPHFKDVWWAVLIMAFCSALLTSCATGL